MIWKYKNWMKDPLGYFSASRYANLFIYIDGDFLSYTIVYLNNFFQKLICIFNGWYLKIDIVLTNKVGRW